MWHVSSRSGVATLRTAIHLLLNYFLTYLQVAIHCTLEYGSLLASVFIQQLRLTRDNESLLTSDSCHKPARHSGGRWA